MTRRLRRRDIGKDTARRVLLVLVMFITLSAGVPSAQAQQDTPITIWTAPAIPADVRAAAARLALSPRYTLAPDAASADVRLNVASEGEGLRWVYAVVMPFPTIPDTVAWGDVMRFWAGAPGALSHLTPGGLPPTLTLGVSTAGTLAARLGAPAEGALLEIVPDDGVLAAAWEARPLRWAIVPFHQLQPKWKVLVVDGVDLLDPEADLSGYPLAVTVTMEGAAARVAEVRDDLALVGGWTASTNRDPARLTVLVMTGVTAMTRGTAATMEREGVLYPARDIAPLLQSADLLHINNEVAFAEGCPDPEYFTGSLTFCSKPEYFELLTYVGADVVELTGNHANDWGTEAFEGSLQMYADAGMGVFGGGSTPEAAASPLIVAHNGNTLGFLGCNVVGPERAWADAFKGGSLRCDYDALAESITRLSRQVDVVIVTQQYREIESIFPSAQQEIDFGRLARAGADIVSGSQAHVAQGFSFAHGAFVHYGLGNLFFDQMHDINLRRLFIDRHVIYAGRHISTALFTGMLEDAARPRPMTPDERYHFLWVIFNASRW